MFPHMVLIHNQEYNSQRLEDVRKNLKKVLKALGFLRKRSEERKWALPWGAGALTGYSRSSA